VLVRTRRGGLGVEAETVRRRARVAGLAGAVERLSAERVDSAMDAGGEEAVGGRESV
jgi:hypothetical protein